MSHSSEALPQSDLSRGLVHYKVTIRPNAEALAVAPMSTIHVLPDDLLTRLFFFLPNEEVGTLWLSGDKHIQTSMSQVTEAKFRLVAKKPCSWPATLFSTLHGLRDLSFGYSYRLRRYGVKNVDLSILPKSLTSLDLEFGNLLAELETSMDSLLPELESLTLSGMPSRLYAKLLPLPRSLTYLMIVDNTGKSYHTSMSLFKNLPPSLRHFKVNGEVYFTGTDVIRWPSTLETLQLSACGKAFLIDLPSSLRSLSLQLDFSPMEAVDLDSDSDEEFLDTENAASESKKLEAQLEAIRLDTLEFWSLIPKSLTNISLTSFDAAGWVTLPDPNDLPDELESLTVQIFDTAILFTALANPGAGLDDNPNERNSKVASYLEKRPSLKDIRLLSLEKNSCAFGIWPRASSSSLARCKNRLKAVILSDVTPPEDSKYLLQPLFHSLTSIFINLTATPSDSLPQILLPDSLELPPSLEEFSLQGGPETTWRFNIALPSTLRRLELPTTRLGKKYLKGSLRLPSSLNFLAIPLNGLASRRALKSKHSDGEKGASQSRYLPWFEILPPGLCVLRLGDYANQTPEDDEYERLAPWNMTPDSCSRLPPSLRDLTIRCPAQASFWSWMAKLPPKLPLQYVSVSHEDPTNLSLDSKLNPWIEWPEWPKTLERLDCDLFGFNPNLFKFIPRRLQSLWVTFLDDSLKRVTPQHIQLLPPTIGNGSLRSSSQLPREGPLRFIFSKHSTPGILVAPVWLQEAASAAHDMAQIIM